MHLYYCCVWICTRVGLFRAMHKRAAAACVAFYVAVLVFA